MATQNMQSYAKKNCGGSDLRFLRFENLAPNFKSFFPKLVPLWMSISTTENFLEIEFFHFRQSGKLLHVIDMDTHPSQCDQIGDFFNFGPLFKAFGNS